MSNNVLRKLVLYSIIYSSTKHPVGHYMSMSSRWREEKKEEEEEIEMREMIYQYIIQYDNMQWIKFRRFQGFGPLTCPQAK